MMVEREYDLKKTISQKEKEQNIKDCYKKEPDLKSIDDKIKELGIKSIKLAISPNNKNEVDKILKEINELKEKREALISRTNLSIEPKFECPICHDTGYILKDGESTMCSCMRQRIIDLNYNKYNSFNIQNQTFENFNESLFSNVPNEEKYKTKISPRENIKKIVSHSMNFIESFDKQETKNLLFTGSTGVGKTYLSGCIANEFLKRGRSVIYQTAPLLLDSIFEFKYGSKNPKYKELYDNLYTVDLLIIDDLGSENPSPAKFTELLSLINGRLLNPKTKTIISSNFDLEKLKNAYDDRLFSRFIGNYNIYRFYGDDIRLSS